MPRPKIAVEDRLEVQELFAYYTWGLSFCPPAPETSAIQFV